MGNAIPVLCAPDPAAVALSRQGQPIIELISGGPDGNAPATRICAGKVMMAPGHMARAHQHELTDVMVLLWGCGAEGAITMWGERLENELYQQVGEVLWIPAGVPHAAINPSSTHHIEAYEFRSNTLMDDDNQLLDHFEEMVVARRDELLRMPLVGRRNA